MGIPSTWQSLNTIEKSSGTDPAIDISESIRVKFRNTRSLDQSMDRVPLTTDALLTVVFLALTIHRPTPSIVQLSTVQSSALNRSISATRLQFLMVQFFEISMIFSGIKLLSSIVALANLFGLSE